MVELTKVAASIRQVVDGQVSRFVGLDVGQEELIVGCHHDVLGLNITVYHFLAVHLSDCAQELEYEPELLFVGHLWNLVSHFFKEAVKHILTVSNEDLKFLGFDLLRHEWQNVWVLAARWIEYGLDVSHLLEVGGGVFLARLRI